MSEQSKTPILSRLRPAAGAVRGKRRKGRGPGSGLGKTAGHGQKGQKARHPGNFSKLGFEGGQMPLYRRVPKRGFKPLNRREYQAVNLAAIAGMDGSDIGPEELKAVGLISSLRKPVKILGVGAPGRAVKVRAHAFSASARGKIEAEGGSAELID